MYAFISANYPVFVKTNHITKGVCHCRHGLHSYRHNNRGRSLPRLIPAWAHHHICNKSSSSIVNCCSGEAENDRCTLIRRAAGGALGYARPYHDYYNNSTSIFTNRSLSKNADVLYSGANAGLTNGISVRRFRLSGGRGFATAEPPSKPSSKVEETVQAMKEKAKEEEKEKAAAAVKAVQPPSPPGSGVASSGVPATADAEKKPVPVKKTLKQKVIDEILHYYHGFKLLFIDINVSRKLLWRVLNGHSLTRREYKLLVRTVGDIFRLIPFSVFIIVPCMEFLLPLFIKFFPGMLPSQFQTTKDEEDKMKQSLKVKLEMAKFLQQTLDEMAVAGKGHKSESAKQFAEFFERVRSGGGMASAEEIMKFSKLFQDEITLDSLPRPQLMALCRVLEIQPFGTTNFLRFQLQMKLRALAADDKMIHKEGIDALNTWELQQACKARGMRALGLSEQRLKTQLRQWLDLSLNEKVPPSLLLLSRAFMLPETITTSEKLAATISALPDTVATKTKAAIGELEGKLDNKTKIEVIKEEMKKIRDERKEDLEERQKEVLLDKELLEDNAPIIECKPVMKDGLLVCKPIDEKDQEGVSSTDVGIIENALDTMGKEKQKLIVEKGELSELKEELAEYQEDVEELKDLKAELRQSKAAKRLFKVVNKMIGKLDAHVTQLEKKGQTLKQDLSLNETGEQGKITIEEAIAIQQKQEETKAAVEAAKIAAEGGKESPKRAELLRIDEMIGAIRRMQNVPDSSRLDRISEVLEKMDADQDGAVRLDTVLKVVELIGHENVKLNKKQLDEIIELIKKEEQIELEEQAKAKEKKASEASAESLQKVAELAAISQTVMKEAIAQPQAPPGATNRSKSSSSSAQAQKGEAKKGASEV